jgi:hypothetical protein
MVPSLEQTVERMKREVLDDEAEGRFCAAEVSSFSDLHDHVDANEYGGFCEDGVADPLIAHFGGRDPVHEGMPDGFLDYMDKAQDAVDAWIKGGGLLRDAEARFAADKPEGL